MGPGCRSGVRVLPTVPRAPGSLSRCGSACQQSQYTEDQKFWVGLHCLMRHTDWPSLLSWLPVDVVGQWLWCVCVVCYICLYAWMWVLCVNM